MEYPMNLEYVIISSLNDNINLKGDDCKKTKNFLFGYIQASFTHLSLRKFTLEEEIKVWEHINNFTKDF